VEMLKSDRMKSDIKRSQLLLQKSFKGLGLEPSLCKNFGINLLKSLLSNNHFRAVVKIFVIIDGTAYKSASKITPKMFYDIRLLESIGYFILV
jgi:hypothetical protein